MMIALKSDGDIALPSSAFVPLLAATLRVTQIGGRGFPFTPISSIMISRHVQILCSGCFAHHKALSSISFEIDS
jgi:hypothetical protein